MNKVKLVILGILVAAVLIFSFFFKDKLAAGVIQRGMEAALETHVTLSGVQLHILSSSLQIGYLAVQDKSSPGKNLFELHNLKADIDTAALLKGSVLVENLSASGLQWERAEPSASQKQPQQRSKTTGGSAGRAPFAFPALSLDPETFLAEHRKDLPSLQVLQQSTMKLNSAADRLSTGYEALRGRIDSITAEINALSQIKKVSSPREGAALLKKLQVLSDKVAEIRKEGTELYTDMTEQKSLLKRETAHIHTALAEDYNTISSLMAAPGQSLKNAASAYAEKLLREKTGRYYSLVMKGLKAVHHLSSGKTKKTPPGRRRGRIVSFPETKLPRFLLQQAHLGMIAGQTKGAVTLADLSSSPALTGKPASFTAVYKKGASSAMVQGSVDPSGTGMTLVAAVDQFPFSTDTVEGTYSAHAHFTLSDSSRMSGKASADLHTCRIINPENNQFVREINKMLQHTQNKTLQAVFTVTKDKTSVAVTTSLDKQISRTVKTLISTKAAAAQTAVKRAFDAAVSTSLNNWKTEQGILEKLFRKGNEITADTTGAEKLLHTADSRLRKEILNGGIPKAAEGLKLPLKLPSF